MISNSHNALQQMARLLRSYHPEYSDEATAAIEQCLTLPNLEHQRISRTVAMQIKGQPYFRAVLESAFRNGWTQAAQMCLGEYKDEIRRDTLLAVLMTTLVNEDPDIELLLTALRRILLLNAPSRADNTYELWISSLIAIQGYNNEYVFFVSDEEQQRLSDVVYLLQTNKYDNHHEKTILFTGASMYQAPSTLPDPKHTLTEFPTTGDMRSISDLLLTTLYQDREQVKLQKEIVGHGDICDEISLAVKGQYDVNPFPRWSSVDVPENGSFLVNLTRHLPSRIGQNRFDGPMDILIAGCGTGQQAITAAAGYGSAAKVLCVDISLSSLAIAMQRARQFNASNLEFLHADILALEDLDRRFDIIECAGVLHHMADPIGALRILRNVLKRDGMMLIGLYSELARANVSQIQTEISSRNFECSPATIRQIRREILLDPSTLKQQVKSIPDFYTLSQCRDLLFHVHETRFTVKQIVEMLRQVELLFCGFEVDEDSRAQYCDQFPADQVMLDLANWAVFEEGHPDTFRHMYHFWCASND